MLHAVAYYNSLTDGIEQETMEIVVGSFGKWLSDLFGRNKSPHRSDPYILGGVGSRAFCSTSL